MKTIYTICISAAATLFAVNVHGQSNYASERNDRPDSSEKMLNDWHETKTEENLENLKHGEKVAKKEQRKARKELKETRKALKAEKKAQKARKRADRLSRRAAEE